MLQTQNQPSKLWPLLRSLHLNSRAVFHVILCFACHHRSPFPILFVKGNIICIIPCSLSLRLSGFSLFVCRAEHNDAGDGDGRKVGTAASFSGHD